MKSIYLVDSFIDYRGLERKFVMAAVSEDVEVDAREFDVDDRAGLLLDIPRAVSIGVAVCRPSDDFDEEVGKQIAYGKAVKYRDHTLYATDKGMINGGVVNALLQQEAEYFKNNPGRYLLGYNADAAKYAERKRIEELEENLNPLQKSLLENLEQLTEDEIDNVIEVYSAR